MAVLFMSKIFLFTVSIILCSCGKTYTAKVYENNYISGSTTSEDVFKADNDQVGYYQGSAYYLSFKNLIEKTNRGTVTGFDVYDENGVNLKFKLSKHQIDSLINLADKNISQSINDTSASKK